MADRVRPLLPERRRARTRGQLPLPAVCRRGRQDAAHPQPPPGTEDHPGGTGTAGNRYRFTAEIRRRCSRDDHGRGGEPRLRRGFAEPCGCADRVSTHRWRQSKWPSCTATSRSVLRSTSRTCYAAGCKLHSRGSASLSPRGTWFQVVTSPRPFEGRRGACHPRVVEWMSEQRTTAGLERLADRLGTRDGEKIRGFLRDLHTVRRGAVGPGSTAAVLRLVRDVIGLDAAMQLLETSRRRLDRSAQTDDLDALVALAALHPDPVGFESWLRTSLGHPGSPDGVVLATIHSVKGREWPHVVVHDVSAGLVPHRLAVDLEEERRIFHVGLTRASASVYVVAGDPPSPFLAELAEEWSPARPPIRESRIHESPPRPRRDKARRGSHPRPSLGVLRRKVLSPSRHLSRWWSAHGTRSRHGVLVVQQVRASPRLSSSMTRQSRLLQAVCRRPWRPWRW